MSASARSTQQFAEFLAAVSCAGTEVAEPPTCMNARNARVGDLAFRRGIDRLGS
jgi:hypothetical protein